LDRKFLRAAEQRLESAELLLRHRKARDAAYLGGYVVECAIKALILRTVREKDRAGIVVRITRGSGGHDLEGLKALLQRTCAMPVDVSHAYRRVRTWSTEWRYEPGLLPYNSALDFLKAAKAVLVWVKRSW
jgi:HEPN domain-containing protein